MASCFKEAESGTDSLLYIVEELEREVTILLDRLWEWRRCTSCMKKLVGGLLCVCLYCTFDQIYITKQRFCDILNEHWLIHIFREVLPVMEECHKFIKLHTFLLLLHILVALYILPASNFWTFGWPNLLGTHTHPWNKKKKESQPEIMVSQLKNTCPNFTTYNIIHNPLWSMNELTGFTKVSMEWRKV